ncbi:hypothetical protein G9A89_014067 [Geosiphon pyriformis]|nr:hypothetical protein G9A89_014067 [Geosiphon pyriformis]
MKKAAKVSGSNNGFRPVLPRKKRRSGVLENGSGGKNVGFKSSETGNTTKSNSIDIEKKCLIEETSFDYGESGALAKENSNQTPIGSKIKTKKALGKPLGKINFSSSDVDNNVLLDAPLELPLPFKNLVNVSVCKSFALDIGLNKVVGKFSQEKLQVVRRLFSKINGFGRAFISSKFAGIIRALFTSKSSLVQTSKKAKEAKILVNTDLKKSFGCSDWTVVVKKIPVETLVETVHAVLSKFGIIKSIKMQLVGLCQKAVVEFEWVDHANLVAAKWSILIGKNAMHVARFDMDKETWDKRNIHRAFLYTLLMETNIHNIWNYVNLVGEKTCTINHHPVIYAQARYTIVCFELAESLDAIMNITPVLRGVNLYWFRLGFSKYAGCGKMGYISLSCSVGENFSPGKSSHRALSDVDKNRLAAIYVKHLAPVTCPVAFGGVFWVKIAGRSSFPLLLVHNVLVNPGSFSEMKPILSVAVDIEKRFAVLENSLTSFVGQISKLTKRLDSFVLANQMGNIVMGEGSSMATSGKAAVFLKSFFSPNMIKFENILESLSTSVLSFDLVWKFATCNVKSMNNSAKQEDIVHWHVKFGNMVSIVTETKLKSDCRSWIINKFDGVRIFSSGLNKGFLGTGMVIIMNNFLAHYVFKVEEVLSWVILVRLLFKGKLSIMILGLYIGASSGTRFGQALEVNFFIMKALNFSIFVVLDGDFNENNFKKNANFRFCLDLGLANLFGAHLLVKTSTWSNSRSVKKTINYIFVSNNLSSAVAGQIVTSVSDYFNADYKTVMVSVSLDGLLDVHLNVFFGQIFFAGADGNFDSMWFLLVKVLVNSADETFSRHWFHEVKCSSNKQSSKFFKLKQLVAKVVKSLQSGDVSKSGSLLNAWLNTDESKAFEVQNMLDSGVSSADIFACLSRFRKSYYCSKMHKVKAAEAATIRYAIDKRIENFCTDKDSIIRNILNKPFHKVVLDHLVVDNKLVLDSSKYVPLQYVNDNAFFSIMNIIGFNKLFQVVKHLLDGKAAGLNGIPNELWKHCDEIIFRNTFTQSPISAVGLIVEDALEKDRETYDSVDWHYLEASLQYIKMCGRFIEFFGKIHKDRLNRVITDFGLLNGRINNMGGMTFFFAVGAFVDNIIWIGSSQTVTQFILDVIMVIPINQRVQKAVLKISGLSISIAKHDVPHRYLGIFLLTDSLSKPSLAKAQSDVKFFSNMVLCKAISDKQFMYLVSAVLQLIVSYRIQFSFVSSAVCQHWDDFLNKVLYHPLLYGLKMFEQVQAERKSASVMSFSNSSGIVSQLFEHHFLDLQILGWVLLNSLQFSIRLHVGFSNNFLAKIVCILLINKISMMNNLPNAFLSPNKYSVSGVLRPSLYYDQVNKILDWQTFRYWKKLDPRGLVSSWFILVSKFLHDKVLLLAPSNSNSLFSAVKNGLLEIWSGSISVFMDGSLKELSSVDVARNAAAFFLEIGLGIRVRVVVEMCLDSQAVLDTCVLESRSGGPDFCNCCWIERRHIANLIVQKNISVSWLKVKKHSGVLSNIHADVLAGTFAHFSLIMAIWHPDSSMFSGSMSRHLAGLHSYFMKAVYGRLPVVVRKRLYNKNYPGVLCLQCGEVEFSNYVFTCGKKSISCKKILFECVSTWRSLAGSRLPVSSMVSESLLSCVSDVSFYAFFCKDFVLTGWFEEAVQIFVDHKEAAQVLVDFVQNMGVHHHSELWKFKFKFRANMERNNLVSNLGVLPLVHCSLEQSVSDAIVRLIGIDDSFGKSFGFCRPCLFFSSLFNIVSVYISV